MNRSHRAIIPLRAALPRRSSGLPGSGASHAIAPLFGLAPDGVCRASPVASPAVGSYPTGLAPCPWSPLRDPAPFHPCLCPLGTIGGLLSVALSVASRRPAVSRHPALWGPDFPPRTGEGAQRLPGGLPVQIIRSPSLVRADECGLASRSRNAPTSAPGGRPAARHRSRTSPVDGNARCRLVPDRLQEPLLSIRQATRSPARRGTSGSRCRNG